MDVIKSSIAKLKCGNADGTAFLINDRTALTVSHCILNAIDDNDEIVLTFYNIPDTETFSVKATKVLDEKNHSVSMLVLEEPIKTNYLKLACYEDNIARGEKLLSYGYPRVKGVEGYPIDIIINDNLNDNVSCDYDMSLLLAGEDRVNDYSGMSGSPVIFGNQVIGLLMAESLERSGNISRAVDLKVISNKRVKDLYKEKDVAYINLLYKDLEHTVSISKIPTNYDENSRGFDEIKKVNREKFVIGYNECEDELEDYEKSIEFELKDIFSIKNKGYVEKAWEKLLDLTTRVRASKSKPKKMLARLYYTRSIWHLDDKDDGGNAQKYLQKVLEYDPSYDCRTYYAKKHYLEGNVIEEKNVLLPIDSVSILNTYLQLCIYKHELDDAIEAYEKNKQLANCSTNYLMSLVYILDKDFELAHKYILDASSKDNDFPLNIMMQGVVLYWKLIPQSMVYGDCLLPPMYANSMILINDEIRLKIESIIELYRKALALAEIANNIELQKQILVVWLDTLTISSEFKIEGEEIANKLLKIEEYQCQAIMYLYMTGHAMPVSNEFQPNEVVKNASNKIEAMISCIYLLLGISNKKLAYTKLKEYRFKFEEMRMMEHWYDLAVHACEEQEELLNLKERLDIYQFDSVTNMRIKGMILEARGENSILLQHAELLYQETNAELDLLNLINCCEKIKKWEMAEKYIAEWDKIYQNPLAKIRIIRCLAMQNKQVKCLEKINYLIESKKTECLTNEVLFYEIQALKILGYYDDAILKAEKLWENVNSQKVLFILAECYFLNGQVQDAIYKLKDGNRKGIRTFETYQMLAEYERRIDINDAAKYANKACMVSENDYQVMMWAMQFLFSIGKSEKANEIFVKLQSRDQTDYFRTISFKEAREWIKEAQIENEKRYGLYMKCQLPYHLYIDGASNASYALYCNQIWESNEKSQYRKQPLYVNYGGHKKNGSALSGSLEGAIILDYSSLVHLKHFDLLSLIKECWNEVYVSGNFYNMIFLEIEKCTPNQPDLLDEKKKMIKTWDDKKISHVELPSKEKLDEWNNNEIELTDIISYEVAKENNMFCIVDHFISDLLEESDKITKEMRDSAVSPHELLIALEKRGDISSDMKNKYGGQVKAKERKYVIEKLIKYDGKLPILVDENFLREIYEMDGAAIISQKCEIYAFENVFWATKDEFKKVKQGEESVAFLNQLRDEIQDLKEEGIIKNWGQYQDDAKKNNNIFTNDLIDLIHFAAGKKSVFVCDDRWISSYDNFGECCVANSMDIIEILFEKNILSNEKYVSVITQMFKEGYGYIIPPFEYMKILLWQTDDNKNINEELPEELFIMCNYLVFITSSTNCLSDEIIHQGVIPESAGFMYLLQRNLLKLMKEIWNSTRSFLWKQQVSGWLLIHYSVFSYKSIMNASISQINRNYYELEMANFLFSGFIELPANSSRKEYYSWLFNWLGMNKQWKDDLEEKTIEWLAKIIFDVSNQEKKEKTTEIGVGAVILSVTEDMPEYYRDKIRSNSVILPIIEKFENAYVLVGMKDFVARNNFNQWIEESMKSGKGNSIVRINDLSKGEYTITFVENILFHQGFEIAYKDVSGITNEYYYRIDQAMLLSEDEQLRIKGLFSLSDFISSENMKKYQENLNRPNLREDTVEEIILDIKFTEKYIMYMIQYVLENEGYQMITFNELFPSSLKSFDEFSDKVIGVQIDQLYDKWKTLEGEIYGKIYAGLWLYIYGYIKKSENISDQYEELIFSIASYYSDKILNLIDNCDKNKTMKYTLEEILSVINKLNETTGIFDDIRNAALLKKREDFDEDQNNVKSFFKTDIFIRDISEIMEICEILYFAKKETLKEYMPKLKDWIYFQWTMCEDKDEKTLLRVMEYITYLEEIENSNSQIENYLNMWNEILDKNVPINISFESLNRLKGIIMLLEFEQGIRMREIVERLYLYQ